MLRFVIYPLLILTVVLLGTLVWSAFHPRSWWPQISAAISSVTGSSASKPLNPTAPPNPAKYAVKTGAEGPARRSVEGRARVASGEFGPVPIPARSSPLLHYNFPVSGDITAGTARSAILARFGPPHTVVTNAEHGLLRERFIYVDLANARKTHIFLENGHVIDVHTAAP